MVLSQKLKDYLPVIGIVFFILLFGFLTFNMYRLFPQKNSVISGVFTLNGVIPAGSTLTLYARNAGSQDTFTEIASNISPKDLISWQDTKTIAGNSYQIKAGLFVNGKLQSYSNTITVKSPIVNEVLTFNLATENPTGQASISGMLTINGYIPANATVSVEATTSGAIFTPIASLSAANQVSFQYRNAIAGQTYTTKAILFDAKQTDIGESSVQTIVAPAIDQQYTITSNAIAPQLPTTTLTKGLTPTLQVTITPTPLATTSPTITQSKPASMSGTIQFTGQAPLNSRIVIFERPTGTTNFQLAVDNLPPSNGTAWFWNGGLSNTSYDTIAILKQKQSNNTDVDITDSSIVALTPPVTSGLLTINSTYTLPAPSPNISVACGTYNGNTLSWASSISFQSLNGAQSYWFEIGTTDGGTDLANITQNAANSTNQVIAENLKNGTTYYAKYAYSGAANLTAGSGQFSPLSSSVQLKCSQ